MKIAVAHPGCGPFVQQTVKAFYEVDILESFFTTFIYHPQDKFSSFLLSCLKPLLKDPEREFMRRRLFACPISKCRTYPYKELIRVLASRLGMSAKIVDRIWEWSELSFDRWVSGHLSAEIDAVYTYEHAALDSIQKAHRAGKMVFYEQPSQHHLFFDRLVKEQIKKYPELADEAAHFYLGPLAFRRNHRKDQELATADRIICNSTFTQRTLLEAGIPETKIILIPLGFPEVLPTKDHSYTNSDRLIFLSAGTQSLRKGSHILYGAWSKINPYGAELWLIGQNTLPEKVRRNLPENVRVFPNVPYPELVKRYDQAHVLVLPSLADGFGMVITEAMSRGLPVIATDCTAGPDLIKHGVNGWIVPAGDEEALAEQMLWCLAHRDRLPEIGKAATEKAKSWQWTDYRKAIVNAVTQKMKTEA